MTTGDIPCSLDFRRCLCSSMEEQFRPKERVGGSSPSRGTSSHQLRRCCSSQQFCMVACLNHTHLTISKVPGRRSGFPLESPEGTRFITRSRIVTDDEYHHFETQSVALGDGALRNEPAVYRASTARLCALAQGIYNMSILQCRL